MDFEQTFRAVQTWSAKHGIQVQRRPLDAGKAGVFDGLSAHMNSDYPAEEQVYYLVHALGSIIRWSLSGAEVQRMFDELRDAKKERGERRRLEQVLEGYRAFETESSEFAVTILAERGHADIIPSYTNFMRADLEALTEFHRTGQAPVWREFFAHWNAEVAQGRTRIVPFLPKPVPSFSPRKIENQEILQKQ